MVDHRNARIPGLVGTIVKRHLKYALELLFVPVAAAIVFIERRSAALSRASHGGPGEMAAGRPHSRAGCAGCRRGRRCWPFVAPSLLVMPVKLCRCLVCPPRTQYALSLASVVIGKMLATALVARLYRVLRPDSGDRCRRFLRSRDLAVRPGATGSTPSCAPCRPGRRRRRWCGARGLWMRGIGFRRLVALGSETCLRSFPCKARSARASKASTAAAPTSPPSPPC